FLPPAEAEAAGAAGTGRACNAAAAVGLLRHAVDPHDVAHAHFVDSFADTRPREERAEALRIGGRRARFEPGIKCVDEIVIGVNLERPLAQVAARLEGLACALPLGNGR